MPGDYLVALFSFGRFVRQENPSYRFLKSGNNIIAIFTKSTYSLPVSTKLSLIEVISKLALQRAKKWEVEQRMSEKAEKVIRVYPTNPVKDRSKQVFWRYTWWIWAFRRKYLTKKHLASYWWYQALESWKPT